MSNFEGVGGVNIQKPWYAKFQTVWQGASIYGIAAGYCISASLLSIINKWAIMKFPYPGALTALQYLTSVVLTPKIAPSFWSGSMVDSMAIDSFLNSLLSLLAAKF
jgi:hypothetical protein